MPEQVLNKIGEPGVTVAAPSPNSFAEEELVAAAKSGDEGASETLFKRHQRRMLAGVGPFLYPFASKLEQFYRYIIAGARRGPG